MPGPSAGWPAAGSGGRRSGRAGPATRPLRADRPHAPSGESPIAYAVSQALSKTHAILSLTHEYASALPEEERLPTDEELDAKEPERKVRRMRGRELRLIQGQDIIRGTTLMDPRKMDLWDGFLEQE